MQTHSSQLNSLTSRTTRAGRARVGCMLVIFSVGLAWLVCCGLWCLQFYNQESAKMSGDALISSKLRTVQGTLTNCDQGLGSHAEQGHFVLTYKYPLPGGSTYTAQTAVPADQLPLLGLDSRSANFAFAHPSTVLVEYSASSPRLSRIRGLPYNGGSSTAAIWGGEAIGIFIGVFGFVFFCGGLMRALWLSGKIDRG